MTVRFRLILFSLISTTLFLISTANLSASDSKAESEAELISKLDLKEITGSEWWNEVRLADLTGDNQLDMVVAAQRPGEMQNVGTIYAMDIEGNILWTLGEPNEEHEAIYHDMPIQVHDLNNDGNPEVVYIDGEEIHILNGRTGELIRTGPLPDSDARDGMSFADFNGDGHRGNIVVKTRYTQVWALDPEDFSVMWTYEGTVGHYPWPHDVRQNGYDELVIGHALIAHDGKVLWEADLPGHADGVGILDLNGDGNLEIAVATCGGATFNVLNVEGDILWTEPTRHAQHMIVGNFRPDTETKEVVGLDRGTDRSLEGQDRIIVYSHDGEELWREERTDEGPERWLSIISRMSNWDQEDRDLILAYRRGADRKPELRDGYGGTVAQFPFPDLSLPNRAQRAQHADILGDPRSEVLIWNARWIYVYGNGEEYAGSYEEPDRSLPNPRLHNYTHYIGMP
ncbi:FG-GAP-like repeat-containing protein [Rhodohalobacter sp. SW132]|uniref:FG-GAP-like repeat-containing protein n=1 Tax=Rhodohalobacter sp. SW132 TaxID=2293433 RepID=UPI0013150EC4|nr:FG-GAP-like repeat-containing protein [Rhodohalobacter sp. SW132]